MRKRAVVFLSVVLSVASAQGVSPRCVVEQQAVSDVSSQFVDGEEKQSLDKEGAQLNADSEKTPGFGVKFKVTWKNQSMVLGVPETTMAEQRFVLSVPQMTMKTRGFSLDVPVTRMGTQTVAYKPEFTCRGFLKCNVKMTPVKIDVPEFAMERRDFKVDVPEFTYATTSFVFGVPEFKMKQTRVTFGVPEFTVVEVSAQTAKDLKGRGDALAVKADQYNQRFSAVMVPKIEALFDCHKDSFLEQRNYLVQTYELQVQSAQLTINYVSSQGGNPSAVPAEGGKTIDLIAALNLLYANREQSLKEVDAKLKVLDDEKNRSLAQFRAAQ